MERVTEVKVPSPPVEVEMEVPATSYLGQVCTYYPRSSRSHRLRQKTSETEFQSEGGYHGELLERYNKGSYLNPSLSCIISLPSCFFFFFF